jgi:anaerobic magnesium-protoporphyrin IX monomethyl ester cyclase
MDKVALLTSPPWEPFAPSPGLGYVAASLTAAGIENAVFDLNHHLYYRAGQEERDLWLFENAYHWNFPERFASIRERYWPETEAFLERVLDYEPGVVGLSVAYSKELMSIEAIKHLKGRDPALKVVLGGPAVTATGSRSIYIQQIPELIDAIVVGEGEVVFPQALRCMEEGRDVRHLPGVMAPPYSDGPFPITTVHLDLDCLPYPTYQELQSDRQWESLIMVISRSCVANCSFCNVRTLQGKFRTRSAANVMDEIHHHSRIMDLHCYNIYDSAVNGNLQVLDALCDEMIASDYPLDWGALAIVRKDMPKELFHKMRAAGCRFLEIGIESGSDTVLKAMRKPFLSSHASTFLKNAHEAGIQTVLFLIVGFPGEGEKEFQETISFVKENEAYIDRISSINVFMVLEGSPIAIDPDRFDIILPEERWDFFWTSKDGRNTYDYRKAKTLEMCEDLEKLDIDVVKTNFID